ncbi:hypothetical protein AHF37_09335, partial [Paragonimus kellicotti]
TIPNIHLSNLSYHIALCPPSLHFTFHFPPLSPKDDEANVLYRPNQWANYAILLLQGRAHVHIGNEGLLFEAGPFVMFGEVVLKPSVAAAVASTIGEQHNDTTNAHSDDSLSVTCQSPSPSVPSPPQQDRAPNSIRIVRPYNCTTPNPHASSDDSTIHKRNSLFIPHSGDVLASRPDEIRAFVSHANELTNSDGVNVMFPELNEKADPAVCSARLASEARFVPDYLLKAVTNLQYLRITPEHYLVARRLSAVILRLANSGKSRLSSSQADTSSLLVPKLHQLPGLGPVKINSHDMFQNAWDHHVVRLREASVAAAVASTIGEQHNDTTNAHSDDSLSVTCQSPSPSVPSPPQQDRAPNSIRIVRPYNCTTPNPHASSDDSTIHKRNSLFIPHSGDVLASRPDEIRAFVSHANELTNSDGDPTRPFRSKARAVHT